MKRRVLAVITAFLLVLVAGCKSEGPNGDYSVVISGDEAYKVENPKALAEWQNLSARDRGIQINDILFLPGSSIADTMARVEASEMEFTYDYNPEKLVEALSISETIIIFFQGLHWITIKVYNPYNNVASLKDLVTGSVVPTEEAKPFTRYIDGRSIYDFSSLSYQDVLAMQDNIFADFYVIEDSSGRGLIISYRSCDYVATEGKGAELLPNTSWLGCNILANFGYRFTIDRDTNKVIDVDMESPGVYLPQYE